jgi:hypothetical protein
VWMDMWRSGVDDVLEGVDGCVALRCG